MTHTFSKFIIQLDDPECMPTKANPTDSGYDLKAFLKEPLVLEPGQWALVPCGFKMQMPIGVDAQIRPRSGLALKNGVTVANSPGSIDNEYRGPIAVILYNYSKEPYTVFPYSRIAQMVFGSVVYCDLTVGEVNTNTSRGTGGFGSSD